MKNSVKHLIIGILISISFYACSIQDPEAATHFKLPALVGNNMVLQQNTKVSIWGWARSKQKIKIQTTWDNKHYSVRADKEGNWNIPVETVQAGGPYEIIIKADSIIMLTNIMLGEVWVCSGQSNMEWPLSRAESAETEIPSASYQNIRLFKVAKTISPHPLDDVDGNWDICTPEIAKNFSAVGFFFGKALFEKMNVPVGLINTSWGGTPSEAWTSEEGLIQFESFKNRFEELRQDPLYNIETDKAFMIRDSLLMVKNNLIDFQNMENPGKKNGWMNASTDITDWEDIECPGEWTGIPDIGILEGVMWLRKDIEIPSSWIGKPLLIDLGPIDELNETWINGTRIGYNDEIPNWNKDCSYTIPKELVKNNKLAIVIRAVNTVAEGGLIGKPEQLKIYPKGKLASESISLSGSWKYNISARFQSLPLLADPHTPSYLFNGMLSPLTKMTIKGAIWYQGEDNASRAMQYREIFPAMIVDWRQKWGIGAFPFYFVQLAPFEYGHPFVGAELREAQFLTLNKVPNTGMAVIMDIGDPADIHPTNKKDVGYRLAQWALANDYGYDIVYSGPLFDSFTVEEDKILIAFNYTGSGLMVKGDSLIGFEVAGADQVYHPATAEISADKAIVRSDAVNQPVAVRYGWANAAEPNLFNREGFPASSFRSDDWERVTAGIE